MAKKMTRKDVEALKKEWIVNPVWTLYGQVGFEEYEAELKEFSGKILELQTQWKSDPCWDIEKTEGFEEYEKALGQYRWRVELDWSYEKEEQFREEMRMSGFENLDRREMFEYVKGLENRISDLESKLEKLAEGKR